MKLYEFILGFVLTSTEPVSDELIDELYEAGCDDALLGIGRPGYIAFDFGREAESASDAVWSAIADVRRAISDATFDEIEPDLVGATEIAQLLDCSRQNIRQLLHSGTSLPPAAAYSGSVLLWHLYDILRWLIDEKGYDVSPELLEVAELAMRINAALGMRNTDQATQDALQRALA